MTISRAPQVFPCGEFPRPLAAVKHRPDEASFALGRAIRQAVKDYFYPQAPDWKEMVVWRSHQIHRQALEGLNASI